MRPESEVKIYSFSYCLAIQIPSGRRPMRVRLSCELENLDRQKSFMENAVQVALNSRAANIWGLTIIFGLSMDACHHSFIFASGPQLLSTRPKRKRTMAMKYSNENRFWEISILTCWHCWNTCWVPVCKDSRDFRFEDWKLKWFQQNLVVFNADYTIFRKGNLSDMHSRILL